MNKFIGIGNLCQDIELRATTSGKTYVQNAIAIRNDFKNADGEYDSQFINFIVWGKTADYLVQYAQKGMKIAIEGRLNRRSYDKSDGTKGYVNEIVCNSVELLGYNSQNKQDEIKDTEESTDPYTAFGEQIEIDDNFLD